jgi:hypothetical protein
MFRARSRSTEGRQNAKAGRVYLRRSKSRSSTPRVPRRFGKALIYRPVGHLDHAASTRPARLNSEETSYHGIPEVTIPTFPCTRWRRGSGRSRASRARCGSAESHRGWAILRPGEPGVARPVDHDHQIGRPVKQQQGRVPGAGQVSPAGFLHSVQRRCFPHRARHAVPRGPAPELSGDSHRQVSRGTAILAVLLNPRAGSPCHAVRVTKS